MNLINTYFFKTIFRQTIPLKKDLDSEEKHFGMFRDSHTLTQLSSSSFLGSVSSGCSALAFPPFPFFPLAFPLFRWVALFGLSWLAAVLLAMAPARALAGCKNKHFLCYKMPGISVNLLRNKTAQFVFRMLWIGNKFHSQVGCVRTQRSDCVRCPLCSRPKPNSADLELTRLFLMTPKQTSL